MAAGRVEKPGLRLRWEAGSGAVRWLRGALVVLREKCEYRHRMLSSLLGNICCGTLAALHPTQGAAQRGALQRVTARPHPSAALLIGP